MANMDEFDCFSKEDAIYQGYDMEDDSEKDYVFSISEPEIEDGSDIEDDSDIDTSIDPEHVTDDTRWGTMDPERASDDAEWGTSDHPMADDSGIEDADSYKDTSAELEAEESWMLADWNTPDTGKSVSSESYVFDGGASLRICSNTIGRFIGELSESDRQMLCEYLGNREKMYLLEQCVRNIEDNDLRQIAHACTEKQRLS